jgi:hypothetical protein
VWSLPLDEFFDLLAGLSPDSRWLRAYDETPVDVDTPEGIAALLGSYHGPPAT